MAGPTDPLTTPRHKASILSLKAASVVGRAGVCGSRPGFTVVLVVVLGGGGGGPGRRWWWAGRRGRVRSDPWWGLAARACRGALGLAGAPQAARRRQRSERRAVAAPAPRPRDRGRPIPLPPAACCARSPRRPGRRPPTAPGRGWRSAG